MTATFQYLTAFDRNIGWVTEAEQETLRSKRVAIAGMGGVGGVHLLTLVRLGIGRFHVSDFDTFDVANFNRQVGASMSTVGQPKVEVLTRMAQDVNPEAEVRCFAQGVTTANVDEFLDGVDLYVDGLDYFAFDARQMLFAACHRRGVPAITVAPAGMGAALLNFMPGGMSFEDYFGLDGRSDIERAVRFAVGLAPAGLHRSYLVDPRRLDVANRKFPSTIMGCQVSAGVAGTEALKILLGRGKVRAAPHGVHFDAFRNLLVRTWRPGGHRHPLQRLAVALGLRMLADHRRNTGIATSRLSLGTTQAHEPAFSGIGPEVMAMAEAAILAPSADNCHDFRLKLSEESLRLRIPQETFEKLAAHRRFMSLIALGAAAESGNVAAAGNCRAASLVFDGGPQPTATLSLLNAVVDRDELADAIPKRHTNRRMYRGPGPDEGLRIALGQQTSQIPECKLVWLDGPLRRRVQMLIWAAESERFKRRTLHQELFESIRFDLGWKSSSTEALAPASLEVEAPMRPLFQALKHWPLMQSVNCVGGHRALGLRAGLMPSVRTPALAVLVCLGSSDGHSFSAGRALLRCWLAANFAGFSVQPMAASIVLMRQSDADDGASSRLRKHLRTEWRDVLGDGAEPMMVLRMGRATQPTARSQRLPLAAYLDS